MDWLLLGLGNPGPQYLNTRHNAGFWLIDLLSQELRLVLKKPLFQNAFSGRCEREGGALILAKPQTYMNRSGAAVWPLLNRYEIPPERCLVFVDQLDLPPGALRLKPKGSAAGHNGLKSLSAALGHEDFPRLYIGIGRPAETSVVDHVLGTPSRDEAQKIIDQLKAALPTLLQIPQKGLEAVMNQVNALRKTDAPEP